MFVCVFLVYYRVYVPSKPVEHAFHHVPYLGYTTSPDQSSDHVVTLKYTTMSPRKVSRVPSRRRPVIIDPPSLAVLLLRLFRRPHKAALQDVNQLIQPLDHKVRVGMRFQMRIGLVD